MNCFIKNGKPRPYACKSSFDKLEFYGNDGSLLGTVMLTKGQPPALPLPFDKAKSAPPVGQTGPITYFDLRWIYGKKSGTWLDPHEIYLENDVTTTKFKVGSTYTMQDKSEAWIDINTYISGDPSPAN